MSEKRFKSFLAVNNHYCIKDKKTENEYDVPSKKESLKLVDLLNALNDENEQLRQTIEEYEKSIDLMVEKSADISTRNVVLHEKIGELQRKLREKEEEERLYAQEILELRKTKS